MKLLTIIGARPQFIKSAMLSRALSSESGIDELLLHTGQHYDDNMSSVFFAELGMAEPAINLGIRADSNITALSLMLNGIDEVIRTHKPGLVLVFGDTNSTLAGALAARMNGVPLAHVEAGMRHGDLRIAEELNRVLTDRVSDYLFCSTEYAMRNLELEGFEEMKTHRFLCGDLMIDAAKHYSAEASVREFPVKGISQDNFILCTIHRAENVDDKDKLAEVLSALDHVAENIPVLLPIHPRTRKRIREYDLRTNAIMIDPLGYLDILNVLMKCKMVITDSGGLQKEAFYFRKHSLLLRKFTEWKELEEHGYVICADTERELIKSAFHTLINRRSSFSENFYGNGDAAERIASILRSISSQKEISFHITD